MRIFFVTLFILLGNWGLNAQVILEHTYPTHAVYRLENSALGPVYRVESVLQDQTVNYFFDSLHQIFQTLPIVLPSPNPGGSSHFGYDYSYNFFDNDPEFEVIVKWSFGYPFTTYDVAVYDDDGTLLTSVPWSGNGSLPKVYRNTFQDGSRQLMFDGKIYDAETLDLLHVITDNFTEPVPFQSNNIDCKYCYIDLSGRMICLNQDFSIYQASMPGLVDTSCQPTFQILDQEVIDVNPALEWLVKEVCGDDVTMTTYSENIPLLTFNWLGYGNVEPYTFLPSNTPGISDPVLLTFNDANDSTHIYNLHNGQLEWSSAMHYGVRYTEPNTAYLIRTSLKDIDTSHIIYGMDFQPLAEFPKYTSTFSLISDVSRQTFDQDSTTFEIVYRHTSSAGGVQIVRNTGEVVFWEDSTLSANVSRIPGHSDKFIVRNYFPVKQSKIYALPCLGESSSNTPNEHFPLLMWPNPVPSSLYIDPQTFPAISADIQITDALGRIVWQQHVSSSDVIEVNTLRWPGGLYVVQVVSAGKTSSRTVVKN